MRRFQIFNSPRKFIAIFVFVVLTTLVGFMILRMVQTVEDAEEEQEPAQQATAGEEESPAKPAEPTATYIVEYEVSWSQQTHPKTLPTGAHVSPIVLVSHQNQNDFFNSGRLASEGLEIMAETGGTQTLLNEVEENSAILNSAVGRLINAPGSIQLEITVDQKHSMLSAVSMLAPSPDWFIAINSIDLFQEGQWVQEVELPAAAYDAGTDSGSTFTAPDSETEPAQAVSRPRDDLFVEAATENSFATIKITRK